MFYFPDYVTVKPEETLEGSFACRVNLENTVSHWRNRQPKKWDDLLHRKNWILLLIFNSMANCPHVKAKINILWKVKSTPCMPRFTWKDMKNLLKMIELFLFVHDHLHIKFDCYTRNIDHLHRIYRQEREKETYSIELNIELTFVDIHNRKNNSNDRLIVHNAWRDQMLELESTDVRWWRENHMRLTQSLTTRTMASHSK